MKKYILISLVCMTGAMASAQYRKDTNLRFGVKGAYNSTWLFNTNVSDKGEEIDNASAFGSSFGVTVGYHFNEESSISIDLLFATHVGKFESGDGTAEASEKLSYTDIPVLFRLGPSDGGGYVEIGPQFSFLSGATEDLSSPIFNHTDLDIERDLSSTVISGILGFGYDFYLAENWLLSAGLRFGYGFTDATKEFSQSEFMGADRSIISGNAHYNAEGDFDYAATHRAFGGLQFTVLYRL